MSTYGSWVWLLVLSKIFNFFQATPFNSQQESNQDGPGGAATKYGAAASEPEAEDKTSSPAVDSRDSEEEDIYAEMSNICMRGMPTKRYVIPGKVLGLIDNQCLVTHT